MPKDADSDISEVRLLDELVADLQKRFQSAEDKDAPGLVSALLKALERRETVLASSRRPEDVAGSIAAVTKKLRSVGC